MRVVSILKERHLVLTIFVVSFVLLLAPQVMNSTYDPHHTGFTTSQEDTTPPEIYLHPENMTVLEDSGTITLTWAVRDDVSSYGGYFIDVKIPEISSWWLTMKTYLWYSEQSITFDIDTSEAYTYFIRFKAHDEAINYAEHIIKVVVAPELDAPEIECNHEEMADGRFDIDYTITDDSGISTIVIFWTIDGTNWENLTNNVEEPSSNKEINGQASLEQRPVSYRIEAEDLYGTWGIKEVQVLATSDSDTETPSIPSGSSDDPMILLQVIMLFSVAAVATLAIGILILRKRGAE